MESRNWHFDLLSLVQDDTDLHRVGRYWVGPCPFCGGDDRFNLKQSSGVDLWICRKCGDGKYEDAITYLRQRNQWTYAQALKHVCNLSDEVLPARQQQTRQESRKRKQAIDQKLKEFTTQEIWEALHRRMAADEKHVAWWRQQGVIKEWQDYLRLGWTPEKHYTSTVDGELKTSSAYTIPYFHHTGQATEFLNMQYRFCEVGHPGDRYRFEYGLQTTFYDTTPSIPLQKQMIICEGAKKAIVTRIYTGDLEIGVLGVPSKMDFGDVDLVVKNCQRVWIVLDPDATVRAWKLALDVGAQARVVDVPMKVDDAFMRGGLRPESFKEYLRQGVRVC